MTHAQRLGIGDTLGDPQTKLVNPVRVAGDAAFTCLPVTWGQVVQHEPQLMGIQPLANILRRIGVRKKKLHRLEACLCGKLKAIQKCNLIEQHREVGGKTWHD